MGGRSWSDHRPPITNYELRITKHKAGYRRVWHRVVLAPAQVDAERRTGNERTVQRAVAPGVLVSRVVSESYAVAPCANAIHCAGWLGTVDRCFGPPPSSCTWQKAEPRPQCSKCGRTEKEIESHSGNSLGTSLRACCCCVLRIIAARNGTSHSPNKGARSKVEHDDPKQSA